VFSGGVDSGATIGGAETVLSGGTAIGAMISGGTLELLSGALVGSGSPGSAAITFTGGGELILDAAMSFSGTVAGLAPGQGTLDLKDLGFVPGSTSATISGATTSSATLGVTNDAGLTTPVDINLIGAYGASMWATSAAPPGSGTIVNQLV
jgi:autotransporter passenger strand-loop-strand repeat protein